MKVLIGNINIDNYHMLSALAGLRDLTGALSLHVKYQQVSKLWRMIS